MNLHLHAGSWLLLGALLTAAAPAGRYRVTPLVVRDLVTGLDWQRAPLTTAITLSDARDYCRDLQLEGTGWRLPSLYELMTLVDLRAVSPALDTAAFPHPLGPPYTWTTTPAARIPRGQMTVLLSFGQVQARTVETVSTGSVWCVRRGE